MTSPIDFKDKSICIIGLGYVGLTLAVTMAQIGFKVNGVEIVEETVEISIMDHLISMSPECKIFLSTL